MSSLLVLGLAGVYLIGVAGVVVAGSLVGSPPVVEVDLDQRLSAVRARRRTEYRTEPRTEPRVEPTAERILIARQSRRRDDAMKSLHRAVKSLERAFTPVSARRMRSDVAAPGSLRSPRSR